MALFTNNKARAADEGGEAAEADESAASAFFGSGFGGGIGHGCFGCRLRCSLLSFDNAFNPAFLRHICHSTFKIEEGRAGHIHNSKLLCDLVSIRCYIVGGIIAGAVLLINVFIDILSHCLAVLLAGILDPLGNYKKFLKTSIQTPKNMIQYKMN